MSVQRMYEPESVFGQIKNNRGFRRFLLQCLQKVSLEVGWLSLAHNLTKKLLMGQSLSASSQKETKLTPFTSVYFSGVNQLRITYDFFGGFL